MFQRHIYPPDLVPSMVVGHVARDGARIYLRDLTAALGWFLGWVCTLADLGTSSHNRW